MSAVCVLTPIVIASWPAISAAVAAAATSLGYQVATHQEQDLGLRESSSTERSIQLAIDQSELVTDRLDRARQITVDVQGKKELWLVVNDANDGRAYDHANWADAKLAA